MSSKKQLREKRRQQRAAASQKKGLNPATLFILITIALVVAVGLFASLRGSDRGDAPWPGAVWSADHGHWH